MSKQEPLSRQISEVNFLQANGIRFNVQRAPKVGFFGNAINVPGLGLGVAEQMTYLKNVSRPGEVLEFNDLTLRFLIDENLTNYLEIQKWMRGIGFPESLQEIYDFQKEGPIDNEGGDLNLYSDGTLTILNGISKPLFSVHFKDMFPIALSDIDFDATVTDAEYLSADVTFRYLIYNFEPFECC